MTRIQQLFERRKCEGKALIAYLTAGDPSPDARPAWSPRSNAAARI